ncbi:MAG: hypothetical protein P1P84_24610 [Deferrisomatales bacterium]|nr:hypothetical protein [Deferrisomatales bacterium]
MLDGMLVIAGYIAVVLGGGPVVEAALSTLLSAEESATIQAFRGRGLHVGGRVIGQLERFLTLTFILADNYTAIGLVLAAKGIIRYGEIREPKDQQIAEYVLVGTMLSLSWAVLVGGVLRWLL